MRTSLCIVALVLLLTPQPCPAQENQQDREKTRIFIWRDEHGVLHMQDTRPEHLSPEQSRMQQRDEFLKRYPHGVEIEGIEAPGQDAERLQGEQTEFPQDAGVDALGRPVQDSGDSLGQGGSSPLPGIFGNMVLVLASVVVLYIAGAWVLYRLGRKFGVGAFWRYLIPIYNIVLLCRCAGLTPWYTLFVFVPVFNIFVSFLIWGKIAERLGKSMVIWGLLCTLLGLPVLILALDGSKPRAVKKAAEFDEHIAI